MTGLGLPKSFSMMHFAAQAAWNGQRVVFFDAERHEREQYPLGVGKTTFGAANIFFDTEAEFGKPLSVSQLQRLFDSFSSQPFQPETPDPAEPIVVIPRLSDAAQVSARSPHTRTNREGPL